MRKTIFIILLIAFIISGCKKYYAGYSGLDTPDWTEETHGNNADPNFSVVFPDGVVHRFDITISETDWYNMQADLSANSGIGAPPSPNWTPLTVACSFRFRTWPNMITREGVMGNEYYKFSNQMSPEHNVKLAFTRMLAGQMDYTPGAFLNVRKDQFRQQVPAIVWNTRAAELSKFVIYESPLTVVCDHPDNILGKPGADFLKVVPTVWDDIEYLGGYPGDWVSIAKRSGNDWFIGIMNDTIGKTVELKLDFLQTGKWDLETWSDTRKSDSDPADIRRSSSAVTAGDKLKVTMARNGGWVAIARKK